MEVAGEMVLGLAAYKLVTTRTNWLVILGCEQNGGGVFCVYSFRYWTSK